MRTDRVSPINKKVDELRSDYLTVTGSSFSFFYCPILFRDEDVDLCRAHIINEAFPDSARHWTIQRGDVDSFYGGFFEGDFTNLQYPRSQPLEQFLIDPGLSRRFSPQLLLNDEPVQYFVPRGSIPDNCTGVMLTSPNGEKLLALKMKPDLASSKINNEHKLEIAIEKDLRLSALVSLLKAAHLTLFAMLGYRYALSPAGVFLGHIVLGQFFLENKGLRKADVIGNAAPYFSQFVNMVRPVLSQEVGISGTISDGFMFMCFCGENLPWAVIVFIRTGDRIHAVLVPVFVEQNGAAFFDNFLRSQGTSIQANRCFFTEDKWQVSGNSEALDWPNAQFS